MSKYIIYDQDVGPRLPMFTPEGADEIETIITIATVELRRAGYEGVRTPHIHRPLGAQVDFRGKEADNYQLRRDFLHSHKLIFRAARRSYRDLPFRIYEFGMVYRPDALGITGTMMLEFSTFHTLQQSHEVTRTHDQIETAIRQKLGFPRLDTINGQTYCFTDLSYHDRENKDMAPYCVRTCMDLVQLLPS